MPFAASLLAFTLLLGPNSTTRIIFEEPQGPPQDALHLKDVQAPSSETERTRERRARDIRRLEGKVRDSSEGLGRARHQIALASLYLDVAADPAVAGEAQVWVEKARALSEQVLTQFPAGPHSDEAQLNLGRSLILLGAPDEAREHLAALIQTSPNSPLVPEAYLLLGERAFDQNNMAGAIVAYQHAAMSRDAPTRTFAQYKLAWCYDWVGDYESAISTMSAVVRAQPAAPLLAAAKAGLISFYADSGDVGPLYELLDHLPAEGIPVVEDLAQLYLDRGLFDDAIGAYRRLLVANPWHSSAPSWQGRIVYACVKLGRREQHLTELERYLRTYGKASAWVKANADHPEAVAAARDELERLLREAATYYHQLSIRSETQTGALRRSACQLYDAYLAEYPDTPSTVEVHYSYGELLYRMKRFGDAYAQYMQVVALDPSSPHAKFCAESAIFAADEMVKREAVEAPTPPSSTGIRPIPLSAIQQKLVDACAQFVRLWPADPKAVSILYKQGYIYHNQYQFDLAEEIFRQVIAREPGSPYAEQSATLILDRYYLSSDWAGLRDQAWAFYNLDGLGSEAYKKDLLYFYERASRKIGGP